MPREAKLSISVLPGKGFHVFSQKITVTFFKYLTWNSILPSHTLCTKSFTKTPIYEPPSSHPPFKKGFKLHGVSWRNVLFLGMSSKCLKLSFSVFPWPCWIVLVKKQNKTKQPHKQTNKKGILVFPGNRNFQSPQRKLFVSEKKTTREKTILMEEMPISCTVFVWGLGSMLQEPTNNAQENIIRQRAAPLLFWIKLEILGQEVSS